ncbi:MAG: NAD(P)-dependent oxidoreductase [Pseudanabaena sp. SU_2_4]|nr:NAD(P)-dependent oxidoreductase [Pseudanabaena sp. SU_2_4]
MNPKIAFLGLGIMGGSMAANLARHGFEVTAWNRTSDRPGVEIAREAGAAIATSISEAVTNADAIFVCVSDVPDVEAVLLGDMGVVHYARHNALVVDTSTIGPQAAKRIAQALQAYNLRFLDAPISGGDIGAKNGTLTIMVGGEPVDFEECQPLLAAMGKTIRWCGPVGSGQGMKLCNQVLVSAYMIGICETMLLAEQIGIDPNLVVEVCGSGAAASWALSNLGMKVAKSDFQPGFTIANMLKDLKFVTEAASNSSRHLMGVELAQQLFQAVQELDGGTGGTQGTQAMIRAYRENQSQ